MTDSFVLQTLQKVQTAIDAVQAASVDPDLSQKDAEILSQAFSALTDLRRDLIDADITSEIDAIKADTDTLQQTVTSLQAAAAQLKTVVDAVNTVSQAVGALAQIVGMVARFA
jgi:methyl-accepting chemotaxis protein